MKTVLVLSALLVLSACSYHYASGVIPPADKAAKDSEIDQLTCAYQARNHSSADAAGFVPIAGYAMEKHIRREEFRNCMEARGYRVIPATD